jgi:putative tricarboxylic transport membrane protein
MIPACLFGIPAAPFAAMVMAICMYFGMEIGTPSLLDDINFTNSLAFGYIFGTIGVALLSIFLYKWILKVLEVPFWIYATFILAVIIYANMQYTGGWEDLAVLTAFSIFGVLCKKFQVSRPALLIGYILSDRIYNLTYQLTSLHTVNDLITRPIFIGLMICVFALLYWGITKRSRLDYA